MTLQSDFDIQVYLILSRMYGQLDLLLRDTVTAIREIGHGTQNVNRYEYREEG